ncbi:MAG: hypothetical protein WC307_06920 [Candidatus Nanoarchaeia archaeon]|jgi:predicted transcriptional regulator
MVLSLFEKNPSVGKLARKLRSEGLSTRAIAAELSKQGIEIGHCAVNEYLKGVTSAGARLLANDQALEQQAREEILNSTSQMRKISDELWGIVEKIKLEIDKGPSEDGKDVTWKQSIVIKALDKITKLVELNEKISGRISSNKIVVNQSFLDMSSNINVHLKKVFGDLTKRGVITINKPEDLMLLGITNSNGHTIEPDDEDELDSSDEIPTEEYTVETTE